MTEYQGTSAGFPKPEQVMNVININNFNNNIFNIIGTSGVSQRPSVKSAGSYEAYDAESLFQPQGYSKSDPFPVVSTQKEGIQVDNLEGPRQFFRIETRTQKSHDFLTHQKYQDAEMTIMWGFATVLVIMVSFAVLAFWMFGSKMLPATGNPIIDFMREDYHYCCVIPLLYPVFFIFIYKNWASLKAFRHN